jgi:hypothetical protein
MTMPAWNELTPDQKSALEKVAVYHGCHPQAALDFYEAVRAALAK